MEQRPLGRTEITISVIGLGCVTFGSEIDEETSYQVMDYAMEKGITFFDTAESYGGGQRRLTRKKVFGIDDVREVSNEMYSSERIVGDWMSDRGCRDEITLCTKVSTGGSPENIAKALSASLERLRTDHVDIYKMHSPDTSTPIAETLSALTAEVDAGRVRVIGGSNYSAAQLQEALDASASAGYRRFEILQPAYSLVRPEDEVFGLCRTEGIAVTPYSPLAAGFLTGKYTPDRSEIPYGTRLHMSPGHADMYFTDRNFRIVDRLREKAAELDVPMVRLAMAWAMTHADVTATLIGARTKDHIDNALQAWRDRLDPDLHAEMSAWD